MDNIVVNSENLKVTFVDLDDVVIIEGDRTPFQKVTDPARKAAWSKVHRYERIPCDRCFAYVPQELQEHYISDINLYSICFVRSACSRLHDIYLILYFYF